MKKLTEQKLNELTNKIKVMTAELSRVKAGEKQEGDRSENTLSTQLYQTKRERRVLRLICNLLTDKTVLSDEDKDTLVLITTLEAERTKGTIVKVQAGDVLSEVLERYKDVKDLFKKLQAYCEKNGLVIDFAGNCIKQAGNK